MTNRSIKSSRLFLSLLAASAFSTSVLVSNTASAQTCGILELVTCSDNAGGQQPGVGAEFSEPEGKPNDHGGDEGPGDGPDYDGPTDNPQ